MSAPAALAISKLVYPETEESPTGNGKTLEMDIPTESNVIEAAANGASLAVSLAANIVGMLIAFLAIIALLDASLGYFGGLVGWTDASFMNLCGFVFYPLALFMGVPSNDCQEVG